MIVLTTHIAVGIPKPNDKNSTQHRISSGDLFVALATEASLTMRTSQGNV